MFHSALLAKHIWCLVYTLKHSNFINLMNCLCSRWLNCAIKCLFIPPIKEKPVKYSLDNFDDTHCLAWWCDWKRFGTGWCLGGEGSQWQGTAADPPRLVQHIFYSAVKMAASEGARSGRTSAKRSWNAPDLSESHYPWGGNSCPDTIWITGIDTIAVTPRFCNFIVKSRVGGFHW